MDIDNEWLNFLNNEDTYEITKKEIPNIIPKCGDIKISTKSKIFYFNINIVLEDLFWKLDMIPYDQHKNGIIKKQMKFDFDNRKEVEEFIKKKENIVLPFDDIILNQVDNPNGRVVFKDKRKITIGMSKNDMIKKKKSKSAFYNSLVIIYRIYFKDKFNELHLKIFNSGKVEIPGIQDDDIIPIAINIIKELLQPFYSYTIYEYKEKQEIILVNSNFNCNFYIEREKLYRILKNKYKIKCTYDSCSYPGIQCKYNIGKNYVSFMIFRTGSILIVGKCDTKFIYEIYYFIKNILHTEFREIYQYSNPTKIEKCKKKIIKNIYT